MRPLMRPLVPSVMRALLCCRVIALCGVSLLPCSVAPAQSGTPVPEDEGQVLTTDLAGVSLRGANLRYAGMRDADLRDADLSSVDLGHANLRGADLRGALLAGARLEHTNLRQADLRGTDLRATIIRWSNFSGAHYDTRTQWPLGFEPLRYGANLVR